MTTLVKVIAHDWPVAVMTKDEYPREVRGQP